MATPPLTFTGTTGKLAENIMHFARVLREAGLPIGSGAVLDAIDAAQSGVLRERLDFYWMLNAVFVKKREHLEIFEQAFHVFWKKPKMLEQLMQLMYVQIARKGDDEKKGAGYRRLAESMFDKGLQKNVPAQKMDVLEIDATFTASADEVLRAKDFEQMSVAEQAQARIAIAKLHMNRIEIKTRRFRSHASGRMVDMRRSMRQSLHGGGDGIRLAHKAPHFREPPLVVLCDISGSCSNYSRMFLHFLHALTTERARVSVFLFGTRLTNVTRDLNRRDVDDAIARVSGAVKDWNGGTRIGSTLREFNFKWARRVLGQQAHVLLMTDGLERDNTEVLGAEMQRLRRSARRIVWLNPLLRFDKFEARATGVRVIMPFVDEFRPVHSLNSLEDLAASLIGVPSKTKSSMSSVKMSLPNLN
ncbi:MAG: VWA domain-containing protein [Alphaproteobacteria bacterium]|nr:VWA domain-containing protein [Alphaproteobacteria bacterium]